jgi:hypothetical protein
MRGLINKITQNCMLFSFIEEITSNLPTYVFQIMENKMVKMRKTTFNKQY